MVCYRARIQHVIGIIWPCSMIFASPNLVFNVIDRTNPSFTPCQMIYPGRYDMLAFKYVEFTVFYLIPLLIQIILYVRISFKLFSSKALLPVPDSGKDKHLHHIRMRRGVVKMLIAGVVIYFVCFSPVQVLLFYNTFAQNEFQNTWTLLVFVNIMAYMSSAANPLLYSVFSQKFRHKFVRILCCQSIHMGHKTSTSTSINHTSRYNTFRSKSFKTTITEL